MPSFVARVERPDRGGAWAGYLAERRAAGERWAARLGLAGRRPGRRAPVGHADPRRRRRGAAARRAAVRGGRRRRGADPRGGRRAGATRSAARCSRDLVGDRANRRHRPGRGFEALRYRFEIVSDYGAFRDLQRHRMLTVQWQALTPDLGAGVPEEVDAAGRGRRLPRGARALRRRVPPARRRRPRRRGALRALPRLPDPLRARPQRARGDAPDRAALGREGHPAYRAVAHQMHALIAERHPAVAAAMTHVDAVGGAAARADPVRDAAGVAPRCARGLRRRRPAAARTAALKGARTAAAGCVAAQPRGAGSATQRSLRRASRCG